jgi:hypothetical protein
VLKMGTPLFAVGVRQVKRCDSVVYHFCRVHGHANPLIGMRRGLVTQSTDAFAPACLQCLVCEHVRSTAGAAWHRS